MTKKSLKRILIVVSILFFPSLFYLLLTTGENHFKHLEIYGPKDVAANGDTIYHTIPPFSFINQEGKIITDNDLNGKIYVASFFFATCPTVCPEMNGNLQRVVFKFKDNEGVKFLSHTVNPEHDTVAVLAEYAKRRDANPNQWWFLTGNKDSIYDIARDGYLVNAAQGKTENDFFHSQDFILIDKDKHIRGIYDGLNKFEVDSMMDQIKLLEYEFKEKEKKK
jgi:protein SCO1/2